MLLASYVLRMSVLARHSAPIAIAGWQQRDRRRRPTRSRRARSLCSAVDKRGQGTQSRDRGGVSASRPPAVAVTSPRQPPRIRLDETKGDCDRPTRARGKSPIPTAARPGASKPSTRQDRRLSQAKALRCALAAVAAVFRKRSTVAMPSAAHSNVASWKVKTRCRRRLKRPGS
jgi:hypothetical protein